MADNEHIDGYVTVTLPMDQATVDWLNALAEDTGAEPATLIVSMLKAIRVDDERMHSLN
jgi:hypothetical protein